jgi:hypothetical protein
MMREMPSVLAHFTSRIFPSGATILRGYKLYPRWNSTPDRADDPLFYILPWISTIREHFHYIGKSHAPFFCWPFLAACAI